MSPPVASSPADIGFNCTYEEIFVSLERMMSGSKPPSNVITDVNPYKYLPSNLPDGMWYLIRSKENIGIYRGLWKAKGEACEVFSNSSIIGWRTTLEFYEGEAPHERKTDWLMQEFSMIHKRPCENSEAKEASLMCKIFLDGVQSCNHDKQQNSFGADPGSETHIHNQKIISNAYNDSEKSSSSKPLVNKDDNTRELAVAEGHPNHHAENLAEIECLSRGDYLELLDLDNPLSPSSSSENSSCFTMSSDEYFDSAALLRELETENNQDFERKDAGCKFSVAEAHVPNEVVIFPSTSGAVTNVRRSMLLSGEIPKADSSVPDSAMQDEKLDDKAPRTQNADSRDDGPTSNSHDVGTSSSCHGDEKSVKGRKRKLKKEYLCFMPF